MATEIKPLDQLLKDLPPESQAEVRTWWSLSSKGDNESRMDICARVGRVHWRITANSLRRSNFRKRHWVGEVIDVSRFLCRRFQLILFTAEGVP